MLRVLGRYQRFSRNTGSMQASLADRNACRVYSRLRSSVHSSSCHTCNNSAVVKLKPASHSYIKEVTHGKPPTNRSRKISNIQKNTQCKISSVNDYV